MSSRQLTHIEIDLVAKGLNFSITSKTLPNKDIIATVEDAVKDLEALHFKIPNLLRIISPRMSEKILKNYILTHQL